MVFLPGAAEIRKTLEALGPLAAEYQLLLLPLHGDLPANEQDRALQQTAQNKVILSTNVAESSVTIDGIYAIIGTVWRSRDIFTLDGHGFAHHAKDK